MTEKENWKEEMRKIVKEEIQESRKTSSPSSEHTEKAPKEAKHWTAENDIDPNCPECQKEVEKIGKTYMKKVLTDRKDYPLECEECGTPVQESEEACPTCGNKGARRR